MDQHDDKVDEAEVEAVEDLELTNQQAEDTKADLEANTISGPSPGRRFATESHRRITSDCSLLTTKSRQLR